MANATGILFKSSSPFEAIIETERLFMRPVVEEDLPDSLMLYGDIEVVKLFDDGKPKSPDVVAKLVHEIGIERFKMGDAFGLFTVLDKASRAFVGHFDILPTSDASAIEVGYILHTRWQGQKLGTEIAFAIKAYAKELFARKITPCRTLMATAHPDNVASWKILEKLGMTLVVEREKFGQPRRMYQLTMVDE